MSDRIYYLNPRIKRANLVEEYTAEQILEYKKCSENLIYFIEKYIKINSLDHGLIPFKLRDYQKRLIEGYAKSNRIITLQSRQLGKTLCTASFLLWYACFHPNKTIAILANKAVIAREILSRVFLSLENLPFFLQPGTKVLNKGSIDFANGSRIFAEATSPTAIRGFSINLLYLDEYAFVENAEEFFSAVFPTVTAGNTTKIIISSTANGLNLFYKIWKDSIEGKNSFLPIKVDWWEHPDRDEKWKNEQLAILGEHKFAQEYGNEFLGSSNTLIAGHKLKELSYETPVKFDNEIKILEEPNSESKYIVVVDCSRGVGEDFNTITVFNVTEFPYKTVFTFKSNTIKPMVLPSMIVPIAQKYNNAYLLIERNDIGLSVAETCYFDLEYENILSTKSGGKRGQQLTYGCSNSSPLGVQMTASVKRLGCSTLKSLIEGNKLIQFTEDQVMELYNFVMSGDSYAADSGSHDDLVMNMVLFAWAITQPFYQQLMEQRIQDEFSMNPVDEYDNLGFFTINDGIEEPEPTKNWSIETWY